MIFRRIQGGEGRRRSGDGEKETRGIRRCVKMNVWPGEQEISK